MKKHIIRRSAVAALALLLAAALTGMPAFRAEAAMQDGERFEVVIELEGMEETVGLEHARNEEIGFELDYDYESLVRLGGPNGERFVSVYEDPDAPVNYLEVTRSPEDADTTAAAICAALAGGEFYRDRGTLTGAGDCLAIQSFSQGLIQVVYVIPAADGSLVVTLHFTEESAEGFGMRFSVIANSLTLLDRPAE